ncbi:hypothetical protein [Paraburkholderia bryophila]|uniref:Uncharacterized protein n=1 Tax=Paraburkholderia bryophila TaxID=420952 RepID=A0A7Y9WPM2_9BURK|nr:hypothetical protein [Paraburkholderia bryophila]NYH24238.1 hypothetical protein [Paraburkholderia bryophila]
MKDGQPLGGSVDAILQDFKDAYERLKKHQPRDPANAELLQVGKLRVNKLTLAREAGRSRTNYVNHEEVRRYAEEKLGAKASVPREVPSVETANREYRKANGELKDEVNELKAQLAEMACYVDYLEHRYKVKSTDKVDWSSASTVLARARKNPNAAKTIGSSGRKR